VGSQADYQKRQAYDSQKKPRAADRNISEVDLLCTESLEAGSFGGVLSLQSLEAKSCAMDKEGEATNLVNKKQDQWERRNNSNGSLHLRLTAYYNAFLEKNRQA